MNHSQKPSKDEAILTSVAESIGATLGTIAAKANAVQKAITRGMAEGRAPKTRKQRAPRAKRARAGARGAKSRRTSATTRSKAGAKRRSPGRSASQ